MNEADKKRVTGLFSPRDLVIRLTLVERARHRLGKKVSVSASVELMNRIAGNSDYVEVTNEPRDPRQQFERELIASQPKEVARIGVKRLLRNHRNAFRIE